MAPELQRKGKASWGDKFRAFYSLELWISYANWYALMHPETCVTSWNKHISCATSHIHGGVVGFPNFLGLNVLANPLRAHSWSRGWYIKGLEPSGDNWHEETPEKLEVVKVKVGDGNVVDGVVDPQIFGVETSRNWLLRLFVEKWNRSFVVRSGCRPICKTCWKRGCTTRLLGWQLYRCIIGLI